MKKVEIVLQLNMEEEPPKKLKKPAVEEKNKVDQEADDKDEWIGPMPMEQFSALPKKKKCKLRICFTIFTNFPLML